MALGTPANEVQSTLSTAFVRGTDTSIVLASGGGTNFPSTSQVVRLTDGAHWCLLIYTSKSTDTLTMATAASYALAENVSSGDAAYTWPVGSKVELVVAADYVDELMNGLVDDTTPQLGGDLDVNAHSIVSASNNNIPITPNGTGRTIIAAPSETVTTKTGTATLTVAEAGIVLVSATAAYTLTLPTAAGNAGLRYHFIKTDANYNLITLAGNGTETFNYPNDNGAAQITYPRLNTYGAEVTVVSDGSNWQCLNEQLGLIPRGHIYFGPRTQENIHAGSYATRISMDTVDIDVGSIADVSTWISGRASSTSSGHLVDTSTNPFTSAMLGAEIHNTTDDTYAHISAVNSSSDVSLSVDIFTSGEAYALKKARITAPIAGLYYIEYRAYVKNSVADQQYNTSVEKNNTTTIDATAHYPAKAGGYRIIEGAIERSLDADDFVGLYEMPYEVWDNTSDIQGFANSGYTYISLRLVSKT